MNIMNIEWSAWTKVRCYLDVGLNADPRIPECAGVYEIRISPDYGHRLRVHGFYRPRLHDHGVNHDRPHVPRVYHPYVEGGRVLYVGKSCGTTETKKENDNFTGLSKRVGAFIVSAMGFGKEHRGAGRNLFALRGHVADPVGTPWPTVRDVEARWAVGGCPLCMEYRAFLNNHPRPLFNQMTPKWCGSRDCPSRNNYFPSVNIKVRPLGEGRSL